MNSITERRAFWGSEKKDGPRAGRRLLILPLGVALALTLATVASAQTYRVLKSFTGSDGRNPYGGLVLAGSTLYGTTQWGGSWDCGVVFKVNTDGSGYVVLKSFILSDGTHPWAGLVLSGSTLYGTTYEGGNGYCGGQSGYGMVFKANTDGSGYAVLKSFTGSDGKNPYGGLVLAGSTLYGTTQWGGSWDCGVVFKVNTDGSGYVVLKSFILSDGTHPWAGLVLSGSTLYGTTQWGGSWDCGVVFKVNTDGSAYVVLKSFILSDGTYPWAGLVLSGSTLYGTTGVGGSSENGVVFKVKTDGSGYAVLKSFTGSDGANPAGDLVLSGSTLYGTAHSGGNSARGVVFKVNTDGSGYQVLKNFMGSDGQYPWAGLVLAGSTLYGTTIIGGSSDDGVVFSLAFLSITAPPLTQTAETGSTVGFRVEAESLAPGLAYQWFLDETNALAGATNDFLKLTNVQPVQAGAYTVAVTNMALAVTSAPALLSVIPSVARRVLPAIGLTGGPGSLLHLEYADSLPAPEWSSLSNVTLSAGPQLCFDFSEPLPAQRFYSAWQTNGPQPVLDLSLATEIPLAGAVGSAVRVDYINAIGPTNAWVTLDTVLLTNTTQLYFDLTAFGQPPRLYRLIAAP